MDGSLRPIAARRVPTDGDSAAIDETVEVVVESAVTIEVDRVDSYTLLCTPGEPLALAAGFLFSEGIIRCLEDLASLQPCTDDPTTVRARLRAPATLTGDAVRNLMIVSSCGLCGAQSLASKLAALPAVGDTLRVRSRVLREMNHALRERQVLFDACGGTHAAGIFDREGRMLVTAEDAGRHNALDKAIGRCLLDGVQLAGCGAVLSGRASLEIVGKCARAGIELLSAVSAPTSLAVEVAERCEITLCTFVRETRATLLTHPRRVL